jgi:hypothetical protein
VKVAFERDGRRAEVTIVRAAVARVQSVKDLMELITTASTYLTQKGDEIATRHCRETLDGVVQVLVEHHEYEQTMTKRIQQVRDSCSLHDPALAQISNALMYRWHESTVHESAVAPKVLGPVDMIDSIKGDVPWGNLTSALFSRLCYS